MSITSIHTVYHAVKSTRVIYRCIPTHPGIYRHIPTHRSYMQVYHVLINIEHELSKSYILHEVLRQTQCSHPSHPVF